MKFYVKENYILYGDGKYWGDYNAVYYIWGTWLPKWKIEYQMGIKKP